MENANRNDQGVTQPPPVAPPKKSFANSFAYLKNTDLYKLPEKTAQPAFPAPPRNTNAIIVNSCQRGNPILKFVRNVPYEYGEIIPDYQLGERHCALFLSLRYHNLNPNYIHDRLAALGNKYDLRIILCQVDVKNCRDNLKELSKMCMLANCTLILAWSAEEAGRYLETYKQYEHKPPDILQERVETDYIAQLQDVLTTVKSVNKTDAFTLLSSFGSLKNIINAKKEEFQLCPGFGEQKAQRLYKVFNEPFKRTSVNEHVGVEPETSSGWDGTLPSTSKLKRPAEINRSCSDELDNKTPAKEKRKKVSSSPAKVPKQCDDHSSTKTESNCKNLTDVTHSSKGSINTSPMKESRNTIPIKKSDASSKNTSDEASPSKQLASKSSYLSKTQAILNAGLSRYKKNTNVSPCKAQTSDNDFKVAAVSSDRTVLDKQPNKQLTTSSRLTSDGKRGAVVKVREKSKPCSDEKQQTPVLVTEKLKTSSDKKTSSVDITEISKPTSTVTSPAVLSINSGRNKTYVEVNSPSCKTDVEVKPPSGKTDVEVKPPNRKTDVDVKPPNRKTDVQVKPPSRTRRVLTLGGSVEEQGQKFRVGTRVSKVISPPAKTTSPTTQYSRELTNEEYDDLLASDEDGTD